MAGVYNCSIAHDAVEQGNVIKYGTFSVCMVLNQTWLLQFNTRKKSQPCFRVITRFQVYAEGKKNTSGEGKIRLFIVGNSSY